MNPSDQYVWHCPSCGRHVPRRIEECRCGCRRTPDTATEAASGAPTPSAQPPASGGGREARLLVTGLLLGLALAAIPLWSLWPGAPLTTVRLEPDRR
jgi:hypothetical protein